MPQPANPAGPLMLDLEGPELRDSEARMLTRPQVGGVILFARNYQNPAQLRALTTAIRETRAELLIAIDQEGGRVQRCREGFTRLPAMGRLGALYQQAPQQALQLAQDCGWLLAGELIAHGVDISFTPVLDLDRGISQVIGDRSFGAEAEAVVALAGALMAGMHEAGMATTGKHFPGHGGVAADSHLEIPVDDRPFEQIEAEDLQPFARLMANQLDALMPAHVIYRRCDEQPAGFSRFWLQQVLRRQLGFKGLIFSDDLSMEGAGVAGSYPQRAEAALSAGCDMVLVCNRPEAAREVLEWMEARQLPAVPAVATMKAGTPRSYGARAAQARVEPLTMAALQAQPRWQLTRQRLATLSD